MYSERCLDQGDRELRQRVQEVEDLGELHVNGLSIV